MPRQSSCCGEHNTGEQPCEMHLFSEYILNKMSYSADIAHRDFEGSARSAQSLQYLTCEVKQMLCVWRWNHRLRHLYFWLRHRRMHRDRNLAVPQQNRGVAAFARRPRMPWLPAHSEEAQQAYLLPEAGQWSTHVQSA